jgi:hypothetical protein
VVEGMLVHSRMFLHHPGLSSMEVINIPTLAVTIKFSTCSQLSPRWSKTVSVKNYCQPKIMNTTRNVIYVGKHFYKHLSYYLNLKRALLLRRKTMMLLDICNRARSKLWYNNNTRLGGKRKF